MSKPAVVEGSGDTAQTVLNPDILDAALIDADVARTLEDTGFNSSFQPKYAGLFELHTVSNAADNLKGQVQEAADQIGQAMALLGIKR